MQNSYWIILDQLMPLEALHKQFCVAESCSNILLETAAVGSFRLFLSGLKAVAANLEYFQVSKTLHIDITYIIISGNTNQEKKVGILSTLPQNMAVFCTS